jgi:lysophospholipase L1-like esterase
MRHPVPTGAACGGVPGAGLVSDLASPSARAGARRRAVPWTGLALTLALALLSAACGRAPGLPRLGADDGIVAFGDSLTHGSGAGPEESYPAVLARLLNRPVERRGVPGETTAEALRRLPGVLNADQPRLLLLMTGGNDFLRKVPRAETEGNLRAMIALAQARGAAVVLVGVPVPGLLAGPPELYEALAAEHGLPYEGRVLKEVLYDNRLKSDPVHPNARGYERIAGGLAALLRDAGAVP